MCGSCPVRSQATWLHHTLKAELSPSQYFSLEPRAGPNISWSPEDFRHLWVCTRQCAFKLSCFLWFLFLKLPGHALVWPEQRLGNHPTDNCGRTEGKNQNTKNIFRKNKMALDMHGNSLDHATSHMMVQRFQPPTTALINSLRAQHPGS